MADGILILAELLKGEVADITFEMLGAGRRLADARGASLRVALVGNDVASLATGLGLADEVLVVSAPALEVPAANTLAALLKSLMEQESAGLVLLAGTNATMGVGSILSARTDLPFVSYCKDAKVDGADVLVTSQLFGGKILTDVRLPEGRGIISVYPGSFPADAGRSEKSPPVRKVEVPLEASQVVFKAFIAPPAGDVDITKQNVLVALGRGIQTQDNIALGEELAALLGGAVCGSRPVIDQGWLPMTRQVGKSGMTVKPRLYLALGISGAPEHQEGMKDSPMIIAVNSDPGAPIFDVAKYGVVMDLFDLIGPLKDAIEAKKAGA
jgi:electron transfer flavoprotein alpha subunit